MSYFHHENVQALIDVDVQALIDVHVQALIGSPACSTFVEKKNVSLF